MSPNRDLRPEGLRDKILDRMQSINGRGHLKIKRRNIYMEKKVAEEDKRKKNRRFRGNLSKGSKP